jgi:signal transduction histidine kinase
MSTLEAAVRHPLGEALPNALEHAGARRVEVELRVEMAGGRFLLESRPGAGTAFTFELPARPTAGAGAVAEEARS